MRSLFKLSFLIFIPIFVVFFSTTVSSKEAEDCQAYEFIFARGSGQKLDDKDFNAFKTAMSDEIQGYPISFYELGDKNNDESYPAVEVSGFKSLGVFLSAGKSYEFGNSVEKGIKELKNHLASESKRCRNKKFILAGYSQGAMVISYTLPSLNANKILYVATFGDPKLYLPEGKDPENTACKNIGLSNYRVYVPDCYVEEGILNALNPYQQPEYKDKLGVFCNQSDFMCGSSLNFSDIMKAHTSYDSANGYKKAAKIILEKIRNDNPSDNEDTDVILPDKTEAVYSPDPPKDIVVLFDYGQYGSVIDSKRKQKSISDDFKNKLLELADNGARIAFYNIYTVIDMFNDYKALPPLVEMIPFTSNNLSEKIDDFNTENLLQSFRYIFYNSKNANYYGIKNIIENTTWRERAERHIIIVSNIMHDPDSGTNGINYLSATEIAKSANVHISFVTESLQQFSEYEYITSATGGKIYGVNSLNDMKLSKNQLLDTKSKIFSKTIEINQNSDYSIIIVNDVVYGYSREKSLTIFNLDSNMENNIQVASYDSSGEKISKDNYNIPPDDFEIPDCGTAKN